MTIKKTNAGFLARIVTPNTVYGAVAEERADAITMVLELWSKHENK